MTPNHEKRFALEAIAELVEIAALPTTDLPFYVGHALNMHPDDLIEDPELHSLLSQLSQPTANYAAIIDQMLAYACSPVA